MKVTVKTIDYDYRIYTIIHIENNGTINDAYYGDIEIASNTTRDSIAEK